MTIKIQYTYIVGKYKKKYLYKLQKQIEKRTFDEISSPVSRRVHINCIFNDNVIILCLSCNIKKSKTTATLSENNWNKRRYNRVQWYQLSHQHLYCYRFFLSLYTNKVAEIL